VSPIRRPAATAAGPAWTLRPSIEPFAASDGHLYLLDGGTTARFVIRDSGPRERSLLGALDGRASSATELAACTSMTVDEVQAAIEQLDALGLIHQVAPAATTLGAAELDRLDRQLAWLSDRFPARADVLAAQERLAGASIAIVGVGGVGCWAATALACAGAGRFVLVDDDTVELSNLNRQILFAASDVGRPKVHAAAEALRRFEPAAAITEHQRRLRSADDVAEVVEGCDFVVETADWPMYELPRWIDHACRARGIPHITAAQHPPLVRIGPMRIPGRSPCLACVEQEDRARFPLAAELEAFRAARRRPSPTLGTASGLIGTLIATEVVHHLTGAHPPSTINRSLVFDLATFESRVEPGSLTACPHTAPSCAPSRRERRARR
jgi:molybdopterin/thiamine biosynthesis adenylyltransferase